jgi:hypothetical protein
MLSGFRMEFQVKWRRKGGNMKERKFGEEAIGEKSNEEVRKHHNMVP